MSDLSLLQARFASGELLRPDTAQPSIVDLARALARVVGVDDLPFPETAARLAEQIGPARHLVFVLADGLGLNLLAEADAGTFLVRHQVGELRSIFPSTTATALTTLATGAWPNQHGVTGQWTHLSEIQGAAALLPFVARIGGRLLTNLGVSAETAFTLPPWFSRVPRDTLAVFPSRLVNSISSTYFSGGRERVAYDTLAQAVDLIAERLRSDRPTFTYLYTPRIDAETHFLGVRHHGVRAVVNELDRAVEQLALGLRENCRLVVSADHGLLDAPVTARHGYKPSSEFLTALRYGTSGDDRVVYFHLRDGVWDSLFQRLKSQFADRFLLVTTEEAERLQLFGPGPTAPTIRDRFGDAILISSGTDVIEYVRTGQVSRRVDLNAFHSGMSPDEMRVPLIAV
jgi:hypothetical protein